MARSSAVAAAMGGMLETNPCGMSTQTNGSCRSSKKESDSSRFRSFIQDSLRNSTATR